MPTVRPSSVTLPPQLRASPSCRYSKVMTLFPRVPSEEKRYVSWAPANFADSNSCIESWLGLLETILTLAKSVDVAYSSRSNLSKTAEPKLHSRKGYPWHHDWTMRSSGMESRSTPASAKAPQMELLAITSYFRRPSIFLPRKSTSWSKLFRGA